MVNGYAGIVYLLDNIVCREIEYWICKVVLAPLSPAPHHCPSLAFLSPCSHYHYEALVSVRLVVVVERLNLQIGVAPVQKPSRPSSFFKFFNNCLLIIWSLNDLKLHS